MNIKGIIGLVGHVLVLIAVVGLILAALNYFGILGFGFGTIPGLVIMAVVGVVLGFVSRRM